MKKKSLLSIVTEYFSDEPVADAFVDVKTSEGLILRVDELAEGMTVKIVSEDGENVVAEATEFVLEDGQTVSVDETGVITAIKPADEDNSDEPSEAELAEAELAKQVAKETALNERLENIEEAMLLVVSQFSEQKTRIDKLADAPADENEPDAGKTIVVKHSKEDAATKLARFISDSRNK